MNKSTVAADELFGQAIELPMGQARSEFLASRCPDPKLRSEVESLLQAHQEAGHFLSSDVETSGAHPVRCLPKISGYRIEHVIGEGSLGVVYRAVDEKLNRPVAIKVLRQEATEAVRRRVLEEARQTAALSHPAVVTIFAVLDQTDPPAIVMELVDGFPLDRFAAQLNFLQKARLLREVARGLAAAHERGLVHRDLKPGNVVVGPDMRPRILDFGLALTMEEAGMQGRAFEGTPLYASPEQIRGEPLTAASDVFSFGSLIFRVLTGRPPFDGEHIDDVLEAVATRAPPLPSDVAMGIPEDLQAICLGCMSSEPVDRPTASDLVLELGRFLMGEPVRLRPKLYHDALRRSVSEYSHQARTWASQSMISSEERDALETLHRRLLADEDHWIIDARRITPMQTVLACGTWLSVVATMLTVWMLREEMGLPWRWLLPACFTFVLISAGYAAHRAREELACATFLAGAALATAPCTLALLGETGLWAAPPPEVKQLLAGTFTNAQVLAASATALLISGFSWWRLKMTAFSWTTATLAAASYFSVLLLFNWLEQKPEVQALWFLPLAAIEAIALLLERNGRVRWTLPFHLLAGVVLVAGLDVIAWHGPTLEMLGISEWGWAYFNTDRLQALSFAANGMLFLLLMLATQRSASLDLRRAGKLLEFLAILHTLAPLFVNALNHRDQPYVRVDVALYLGAAALFVIVAPYRSRWRILVSGLAGCGFGSYLLVDLELVARKPFIVGLGVFGIILALSTYAYARRLQRLPWPSKKEQS
jgi:serine/threonine protein kinase